MLCICLLHLNTTLVGLPFETCANKAVATVKSTSNAWNDCNAVSLQLFQYDEEVFDDQQEFWSANHRKWLAIGQQQQEIAEPKAKPTNLSPKSSKIIIKRQFAAKTSRSRSDPNPCGDHLESHGGIIRYRLFHNSILIKQHGEFSKSMGYPSFFTWRVSLFHQLV